MAHKPGEIHGQRARRSARRAALKIIRPPNPQRRRVAGDFEMKGPGMTNLFRNTSRIAFLLAAAATLAALASAQGVDPASLAKAPTTSWPTANGDYTGQRHSPLTQI